MSSKKYVDFISETEGTALLTNNDIVDEFLGDKSTFVLKFRKYLMKDRRRTLMVEVILFNDSNTTRIYKTDYKLKELSQKVLRSANEMNKSIREMMYDGDPDAVFVAQDKARIRAICQEVQLEWEPRSPSLSENADVLPDFDAKLPIKIPLFGFTINEEDKRYLTEGFWAMLNDKPELYAYISTVNEEGNLLYDIVPFFHTTKFKFDTDILVPPFSQEWLVSPALFKKRDEPISDNAGRDIFSEIYNKSIPDHLWIGDSGQRKSLAYWIMATYFYDMFDAFPIGHGWGFYGSGKSRMGQLIVALAYHAQFAINMSNADLFRTKEEFKPTMVIDENEENLRDVTNIKDDMINGSYVRGAGSVSRRREVETSEGKIYVRQTFELYSPTFFCSINPMRSSASRSRTITFPMVKKDIKVPIAERRSFRELENSLYEYRLKKWNKVRAMYEDLNENGIHETIKARDHELWLPIFTMMKMCGRWEEDFEDVMEFVNWNKGYKLDTDMTEEERPTLYASIAKLWYEIAHNGAGYTGIDSKKKDNEGFLWYRHPNNDENIWELRVDNLTNIMKAIALEIGYKKDVNNVSVGKSLSMLGFRKGRTSSKRKATFMLPMRRFESIVKDHMEQTVMDLAVREYDSKEALIKTKPSDMTSEDLTKVWSK